MTKEQFLKAEEIFEDISILEDFKFSGLSFDTHIWLKEVIKNKIEELEKEFENI